MTPEQKQRIEQIQKKREQQRNRPMLAVEGVAWDDVDFLLSLVKSQEAGGSNFSHLLPQTDYITKPQLGQKERYRFGHLFYEYTFNNCDHGEQAGRVCKGCVAECLAYLAQRCENAATSMRSAYVEKVRAMKVDYRDRAKVADSEQDNIAQLILLHKATAANEIITELESLSIEKPKE